MLHSVRDVKKAERAAEAFRTECLEGLGRARALRAELLAAPRTLDGDGALISVRSGTNATPQDNCPDEPKLCIQSSVCG